ncbi:MAG: tetratricopeptide repeat protein, partial [Alphaproteobacteria bacterium]
ALLQAAAYINATPGMGVPAYISFFTENKKAYWASESKALGDQPLLYTAIKMSTEKIKASNPDDYTLLVALSLLDTTHLDKTLIEKMYINLTKGDMGGFGRLLDVALMAPEGSAAYRIHDYVRSVIIATATPETLQQAATLSATVFLSLFPEKIEEGVGVFDQNPRLFTHMIKLFDHADLIAGDKGLQMGMRLFYYSEIRNRDFDFAVPYKDKIKKLFDEKGKDADPMLCGLFYSNYGCTVLTGGTVDDSIAEFKKAYAYFKKADPNEARKELIGLLANRLGFFYHWKGDLNKVKELLTEAKQLLGSDTDVFLTCSIDELEAVYEQDLGNFERSLDILNREYARLENDPNRKTYWPFAGSLKVASLLKLSRFKDAEALLKDIYQEALDASNGNADDDMIGRISVYLSQAQSGLGHYKEAELSAKKAIEIINRCYQGTHQIRRQGVAHMALGDALMGQKRPKEALAEYMIADEVFERISSHKAFDDMSELYAKIVNAAIMLKEAMVAREYALRHLETFPKSHDRFVDIAIQMKKAGYYR